MRGIRELAAATSALVLALAGVLLAAPSAVAGGPTSVLVVSPQSAESAALYYSHEKYGELVRLMGASTANVLEKPKKFEEVAGQQINVTWMAHDITPWRYDRVYPKLPGNDKDVWIHTTDDMESLTGYWHKADRPAELRALFRQLGVLGKASPEGSAVVPPAPQEPGAEDATAPTAAAAPATPTRAAHATEWWWAIPGAAAGAVLALVLRPFASRIQPTGWGKGRGPGPRQELIDL
ncbi:hypothetical protein [Streptomyces sp. NBC_00459]|uniref:hypothetical protein n=1 Tax=Streptomyces sp. NBC_00459 TaxID=2975749 RepID=UPI002E173991